MFDTMVVLVTHFAVLLLPELLLEVNVYTIFIWSNPSTDGRKLKTRNQEDHRG